jgi:hypothetical protein
MRHPVDVIDFLLKSTAALDFIKLIPRDVTATLIFSLSPFNKPFFLLQLASNITMSPVENKSLYLLYRLAGFTGIVLISIPSVDV